MLSDLRDEGDDRGTRVGVGNRSILVSLSNIKNRLHNVIVKEWWFK